MALNMHAVVHSLHNYCDLAALQAKVEELPMQQLLHQHLHLFLRVTQFSLGAEGQGERQL